jgi:hypothetical protein
MLIHDIRAPKRSNPDQLIDLKAPNEGDQKLYI